MKVEDWLVTKESDNLSSDQSTHLFEVWKEIIPAPARISKLFPCIIVCLRSSIKSHSVYSRTSSDYGPNKDREAPVAESYHG